MEWTMPMPQPSPTIANTLPDAKLQFWFGGDQHVLHMNSGGNSCHYPIALLKMELRELGYQT